MTCETCIKPGICCRQLVEVKSSDIKRFKEYNIYPELFITEIDSKLYLHLYLNESLQCLHLKSDGRCEIYDARPEACRRFLCNAHNVPNINNENIKSKSTHEIMNLLLFPTDESKYSNNGDLIRDRDEVKDFQLHELDIELLNKLLKETYTAAFNMVEKEIKTN